MEPAPGETAAQFQTRERPGWVAIALIAAFVLAAVGMFLIGAHLVKRTPGPDLSAIAVVPFAGLTSDIGRQSLGVNFTTGLVAALAKNAGLRIVDGPGAGALLEGSVQQSGDRARVVARLVRAAGRNELWAHAYDCAVQDVPALQAEIARDVAVALHMYQQMPQP